MGLLLLLGLLGPVLIVLDGLLGPLLVGGVGLFGLIPLLSSDLLIAALLGGAVTLLVGLRLLGPLERSLGLLLLPGLPLEPAADNPALTAAPKNAIIITYSVCLFGWLLLIFWDLCL